MQLQPRVVVDALLPSRVGVDDLSFRPLTLGDILLLEKLRCPVFNDGECTGGDFNLAAFILSEPSGEALRRWQAGGDVQLESILWAEGHPDFTVELARNVLKGLWASAFDSCVETKWPSEHSVEVVIESKIGNGLGWVLTIIDALAYRYTVDEVLKIPLSMAFVLLTARRIANGAEFSEPNYYEREQMGDIAKELGIPQDA